MLISKVASAKESSQICLISYLAFGMEVMSPFQGGSRCFETHKKMLVYTARFSPYNPARHETINR